MKKTLTVLAATTSLVAVLGLPAWSAMRNADETIGQSYAAAFDTARSAVPLVLVSDDDDDDDGYRTGARYEDDDCDDDDDDDDDHDDDDDDDCIGTAQNAAPSGTVAPPQNGLFGSGAQPTVKMN
ncbi:MAG: hypothetical protein NWQ23_09040 [Yoonia sp.]|uniref:hypothetical protein n=1 Tax=Yoonia sp. TaxID=2212373 RepID=UPI00273D5AE3|nr:hypothetical protein [Yoonia sp.]MDP5085551.1 hypothetical protein [Yoonia sp.]